MMRVAAHCAGDGIQFPGRKTSGAANAWSSFAADPARAKAYLIRSSMIASVRAVVLPANAAAAASFGHAMQSFLFEVQPVDPVTYCAVPILMMLVALFAAWNPARRAAAIEPMQALRND